jgi:branched-chain amino acid transport system substrate-binding protein
VAGCRPNRSPLLIGLAGPFTESRGQSMLLAARLAVREINDSGGVRSRQLRLVEENDSAQTTRAIAVAATLRDDPAVVAVVGHLTSGTTIRAADIYNAGSNPVVEISPSASNPDLTGVGFRYTFRVCATDLVHGVELARFAFRSLGARNVAVLYQNDDYGRGILGTFTEEFRRLGGTIDERDPYLATTADFGPYLERIQRAGRAQVLMIAGDRATASVILHQARGRGITLPVMGGDALAGIQSEGAIAEGVYLTSNYLPQSSGDEKNVSFLRAYAAANGGAVPDHRGAGAYDAIYLIAQAIEQGGVSRAAIRNSLAAIDSAHAFTGVTGRIAFDDHGDVLGKGVIVGVVREGRIVRARTP